MKISVIITIYNVEKFIARCLQSVFAQSFKYFEVIIVNDATLDSSMSIVNKCVRGHDNVTIVNNEHNRGLMMARKVGYSIAKGDYITLNNKIHREGTFLGYLYHGDNILRNKAAEIR